LVRFRQPCGRPRCERRWQAKRLIRRWPRWRHARLAKPVGARRCRDGPPRWRQCSWLRPLRWDIWNRRGLRPKHPTPLRSQALRLQEAHSMRRAPLCSRAPSYGSGRAASATRVSRPATSPFPPTAGNLRSAITSAFPYSRHRQVSAFIVFRPHRIKEPSMSQSASWPRVRSSRYSVIDDRGIARKFTD